MMTLREFIKEAKKLRIDFDDINLFFVHEDQFYEINSLRFDVICTRSTGEFDDANLYLSDEDQEHK